MAVIISREFNRSVFFLAKRKKYVWRRRTEYGMETATGKAKHKCFCCSIGCGGITKRYGFCRAMLYISAVYAVVRCPSVCLSTVCPSRSCSLSKRVSVSIFSRPDSHTIQVFAYQTLSPYSDGDALTAAKIAIFDQYLTLPSITAGPSRVVNISKVLYRL